MNGALQALRLLVSDVTEALEAEYGGDWRALVREQARLVEILISSTHGSCSRSRVLRASRRGPGRSVPTAGPGEASCRVSVVDSGTTRV